MPEVTIVRSKEHDWISLYVDGEQKSDGHALRPEDLLEALDISYIRYEIDCERHHFYSFPERFSSIPPCVLEKQ